MSDNQIVTSIIDKKLLPMFTNPQMGERIITKENDVCSIVEFDGQTWNPIPQTFVPKYIFVSDWLSTIIFFNNKIWQLKKWFICAVCEKLTMNKLKHSKDVTEMCIHCFYKMNHDNPNRNEYDGNPMTIGRYIKKYAHSHRMDNCSEPNKCFLCDYKKNKIMIDIKDKEILYGNNLSEILKNKTLTIDI